MYNINEESTSLMDNEFSFFLCVKFHLEQMIMKCTNGEDSDDDNHDSIRRRKIFLYISKHVFLEF